MNANDPAVRQCKKFFLERGMVAKISPQPYYLQQFTAFHSVWNAVELEKTAKIDISLVFNVLDIKGDFQRPPN